MKSHYLAALLAMAVVAPAGVRGFLDADLTKIERTIAMEPKFVAAPRYALFVLDHEAKFRAWAIFDKSTADAPFYDVLYFDGDGDGDLTEPSERFVGRRDPSRAPAGLEMLITVGDVVVPGSDVVHRGLRFSTSPKSGRTGFWFDMKWNGKTEVSGSYGPVGTDSADFAASPKEAQIIHPDPDGPLSFGLWMDAPVKLTIGGETHLSLVAGHRGVGERSLAAVDENFIDLGREELLATVVARDEKGNGIETTSRIRGHC
jgi:hypothetical protein